jgi:hypothetical protein
MRLFICIFFKDENATGSDKTRFEDFDERSANVAFTLALHVNHVGASFAKRNKPHLHSLQSEILKTEWTAL